MRGPLVSSYDVSRVCRHSALALPIPMVDRYRIGKIDGEYRLEVISGRHWRRFATANGLDADEVIHRLDSLTTRTPDAFATAAKSKAVRLLRNGLPSRLVERIAAQATDCRKRLQQKPAHNPEPRRSSTA
jgi:serine/threonine-protein kinase HipA